MIETHKSSLSDVPVSRNWYKTVSNLYKNLYIPEEPEILGLLLFLFEFYNLSFLINIIDDYYVLIIGSAVSLSHDTITIAS